MRQGNVFVHSENIFAIFYFLCYTLLSEENMILDNVKERLNVLSDDYSFLKECL